MTNSSPGRETAAPVLVHGVERLHCQTSKKPWAFDADPSGRIADNWRRATAKNPKLFDGVILLANRVELDRDDTGSATLDVDFFEARFSRFLAWRDFGFPDREVFNCFAMPALRSEDGAYLVGEMGHDHSNAGQLYFPCGTPDREDVRGATVDLAANMLRELSEEVGLEASAESLSQSWTVVFHRQYVACIKEIHWPESAAALLKRIKAYLAAEPAPELATAHMISAPSELADARFHPVVSAYLSRALIPSTNVQRGGS